ncbi:hypothetical protein J132_10716, partial [Termitomyces sp. J132]
ANRRWIPAEFEEGDFVYVSTKNITMPKGLAQKLSPKFIGPYQITKAKDNESFELNLSPSLKRRGIHNVFHASLLREHVLNDDRLFPGHLDTQISEADGEDREWAVDQIVAHSGARKGALFKILWKSGDKSWLPYAQISHLRALDEYLEAMGIDSITNLPKGSGTPPKSDPQIFLGSIKFTLDFDNNLSSDFESSSAMAVPVPEVLNDPPIATGGCDPSRATTATGKLANLKINVGGNKFLFQEINGRDYQYPSQADHNLMLTVIPPLMRLNLQFDATACQG